MTHDLSKYTAMTLVLRFQEIQRGPLSAYEARGFNCGCDEDCAWDSLDAIEAELTRRDEAAAL